MRTTYHRVDGSGKQIPADPSREFNPRVFERAIHGLQKMVVGIGYIDAYKSADEDYEPGHELDEDDDSQPVIHVAEDTLLDEVLSLIPRQWNTSVLIDQVWDTSYIVRVSVDCGGGILVHATMRVNDGIFSGLHVFHTSLDETNDDIDADFEIRDISNFDSARILTHINRMLERSVVNAYAKKIEYSAPAFDYVATRKDIPPTGHHSARRKDRFETVNQSEWAGIRGKTKQSVSNNVRKAQDRLYEIEEIDPFERGPALEAVDPTSGEADIQLV